MNVYICFCGFITAEELTYDMICEEIFISKEQQALLDNIEG